MPNQEKDDYNPPKSSTTTTVRGGSNDLTPAQQAALDTLLGGNKQDDKTPAQRQTEEYAPDLFWQDAVIGRIQDDIKALSKTYDTDLGYITGWFNGQQGNLINYLSNTVLGQASKYGVGDGITTTPNGIQWLFEQARAWVGMQVPGFAELLNGSGSGSGSGPGRGSGGSGMSAAQIRAQFDLDQLTQAVNDMSRGLVLADEKNARSIAKAYVNAIVSNPEQELDFETYVRKQILATPRAKLIYKTKPQSLSEEQYLQPYVQAAQSRIGAGYGEQLANIATAGAQLNSDPAAYEARLNRTSQVQNSSPYLQALGEQISSLKGVLR